MSQGKLLYGQVYDAEDDFVVTFSQQMVDSQDVLSTYYGLGKTEINPNDAASALVKSYDVPVDALEAYTLDIPSTASIALPDVLLGLNVSWDTSKGEGKHIEDGTGYSVGETASLSLSLGGNGQSSASAIPSVEPRIEQRWTQAVPVRHLFFFLPAPVSRSQVISAISTKFGVTVQPWPKFRPVAETLTLIGQRLSVNVQANAQQHRSLSQANGADSYTKSEGVGESYDIATNVRLLTVPPTIHGDITITERTKLVAVTASAEASIDAGTNWPSVSAAESITKTARGSISPGVLPATTPSEIPSSGTYLRSVDASPYRWGWVRVRAEVIDFADV